MIFVPGDADQIDEETAKDEYTIKDAVRDTFRPDSRLISRSSYIASKTDPNQHAKSLNLGYQYNVDPRLPVEKINEYVQNARKKDYEWNLLHREAPGLGRFVQNPDNAIIAQDELGRLADISNASEEISSLQHLWDWKEWNIPKTIPTPLRYPLKGFSNANAAAALFMAKYGPLKYESVAPFVAQQRKFSSELSKYDTADTIRFNYLMKQEGNDVNKAMRQFIRNLREYRKGNKEVFLRDVFGSGKATLAETFDYLSKATSEEPIGLAESILEQLPYALPGIIMASTAGPGLAAVGATANLGKLAIVMGHVGAATGIFAGEYPIEFGSQVISSLEDRGINIEDPVELKKAFQDRSLMNQVEREGDLKAFGTVVADAVIAPLSGVFTRHARKGLSGIPLVSKSWRFAMDQLIEFIGEGGTEVFGQYLKNERDLSKVDWGEGLNEATLGLGQGIAETIRGVATKQIAERAGGGPITPEGMQQAFEEGLGVQRPNMAQEFNQALNSLNYRIGNEVKGESIRNTLKQAEPIAAAEQLSDQVNDASTTLNQAKHFVEIGQKVRDSNLVKRKLPEKVKELIGDSGNVNFDVEEFSQYWESQGINAERVSEDIMPGGAKAYRHAKRTGTRISFPISDYVAAVAPTIHFEPLVGAARFYIKGKSVKESVEFMRALPATMNELNEELKRRDLSIQQQKENIKQQFKNRFIELKVPEEVAEANAQLAAEGLSTIAIRAGMEPRQLLSRFPFTVSKEGIPEIEADLERLVIQEAGAKEEFSQPAHHASRVLFERFNINKVGTGIGQQAYAWGLSFDNRKDVIEFLEEMITDPGVKGYLYDVEIPENEDLITYTDPLSKQSPKIQEALKKALGKSYNESMTGREAYLYLSNQRFLTAEDASRYLATLGVAGMRIPKEGGNEFVIFDDKLIQIRDTYQKEEQTFFQEPARRGKITITTQGAQVNIDIKLLKNADKSTFLHEMSHAFLKVIDTIGKEEGAAEDIITLRNDITDWLNKITLKNTPESLKDLLRKRYKKNTGKELSDRRLLNAIRNEKFADAFEAFLQTGKAPSSALRKAFEKFRKWLSEIYRGMHRAVENLTPEVRDFMSRILATDDMIAQAIVEHEYTALNPDIPAVAPFDMVGNVAEKHNEARDRARNYMYSQIDMTLQANNTKERKKFLSQERKRITAEVTPEIDTRQDQKLLAFLQKGTYPNGDPYPEGTQLFKLDRQSIIDLIGKEEFKLLPKGITTKENGIDIHVAADAFGFVHAHALLDLLANTPSRKDAIEIEVYKRLLDEHGDPLMDPGLNEEVVAAAHSEHYADMLEQEMKWLATHEFPVVAEGIKRIAKAPRPKSKVREEAQREIEKITVGVLKPYAYVVAERQWRAKAGELYTAGNIEGASEAKDKELLNHYLYIEAQQAKKDIEKTIKRSGKFFGNDDKLAKERDFNLILVCRSVMSLYGLGPETEKTPEDYLKPLKKYDVDRTTYESMSQLVEDITDGADYYKSISYGKFLDLKDSLDALWHVSKSNKEIVIGEEKFNRDDLIQNTFLPVFNEIASIKKKGEFTKEPGEKEKRVDYLTLYRSAIRRIESWCNSMDFKDPKGPFKKFIFNPVKDGANIVHIDAKKYREKLSEILAPLEQDFGEREIVAEDLGHVFTGMHELMHAILHRGNMSNFSKMLRGGRGQAPWGEVSEDGVLDTSKWDSFEKKMWDKGILRKEHYDAAQKIWDIMNEILPAIQRSHKEMFGRYFDTIPSQEFETPWGVYRGGYVPARIDADKVVDQAIKREREQIEELNNSYAWPTTGRGATIKRIEEYAAPLQLNIRTIAAHIDWALRFAYLEPRIRDVAKIVMNKQFAEGLKQIDKYARERMLVPWLQRTAKQINYTPSTDWTGWRFWRNLRNVVGSSKLMGNVTNSAQQWTGAAIGRAELKHQSLSKSLALYFKSPKEFSKNITEKSKFMEGRLGTSIFQQEEAIDDLIMHKNKYAKFNDYVRGHAYILQRITQNQVDIVIWNAAYNDAISDGLSEDEAIHHGDFVVRETQGSGLPEDISAFESGTHLTRMLTMFMTYFNMKANINITAFEVELRKMGMGKITQNEAAARILPIVWWTLAVPGMISGAIIYLLSGTYDADDDDAYIDDLLAAIFGGTYRETVPTVGIFHHAISLATSKFTDMPYDDRISVSPVIGTLENAFRAPTSIWKAIAGEGSKKRAIRDSLTLTTLILQQPAFEAVSRPAGYLSDIYEGEEEPANPLDFLRGITTGKSERKR